MPRMDGLVVGRSDPVPQDVDRLLRALPEWFGIETAIVDYIRSADELPTYCARHADGVVGVVLVKQHFPKSAEIHLMAVQPDLHGRGIGRRLLQTAETDLRQAGVAWLHVKTLGPSHSDVLYARTRKFYQACGFDPLEEIHGLWEDNPCLMMIKALGGQADAASRSR
jgi:N-acetylglutamate synthase-like GNAT family acetyltransferase